MTSKEGKHTIDPFSGVEKPDVLKKHIKRAVGGDRDSLSYINGSIQYLEKFTPNKYIVPVLKRARVVAKEARSCS